MRFFVPGANDARQAHEMYQKMRERVTQECGPVTDRHIYSVKFHHDDTVCNVAVGSSFRQINERPILAIFEGEGCCFVCTAVQGSIDCEAFHVAADSIISVEEFTAS